MRDIKTIFERAESIVTNGKPTLAETQLKYQQEMLERALEEKRQQDAIRLRNRDNSPAVETQWQLMAMQQQSGAILNHTPNELLQIQERQIETQRALIKS